MKRYRKIHFDLNPGRLALFSMVMAGFGISQAHAQPLQRINNDVHHGLHLRTSPVTGLASFVTAADGGAISVQPAPGNTSVTPTDFFVQHGHLFGITDSAKQLRLQKNHTDKLNQTHYTYQQYYKGVEVFSGVMKVHQNSQREIIAANGDFYRIKENINVNPTITIEQAATSAIKRISHGQPKLDRHRLVVVDPAWYGNAKIGAHLAYHMILSDPGAGVGEGFFVDAHSGEVLDQWNTVHTLRYREIYDGQGRSELPGELARAEGDDPHPFKEDVNLAYDYLQDVYGYFFRAFGWDSLDNKGLPMIATVNSGATGCPNAFWSGHDLQAGFCTFTVSDDIVGHEMMHGIVDFTANLFFRNQSGQLNESYADVFGELVDLFNGDAAFIDQTENLWPETPSGPGVDLPNRRRTMCNDGDSYPDGVRWMVGEDARALGGAIRDMWDPTCLNHPDRANSPRQQCSALDSGGVHTGNGIPNHAFAMLTDGKTFNGFTVRGIGPIKSGAVWFRALTTYLTIASDFQDAYDALNRSATDLIGTYPLDPRTGLPSTQMFTADDALQVDLALLAVEMNTIGRCGQSINVLNENPPPVCPDKVIIYANDFEQGAARWSVFNTGPTTPYDWVLTDSSLPFDREGVAWFCADADIGDCFKDDETALHSLVSPEIFVPEDAQHPMLSFTHYMASEQGWDGGTILYKTGRRWVQIPSRYFQYNPQNSLIRTKALGNTNPLANQIGWSGVGGKWGTSVIDLTDLVLGGETVQFRFDFGKDICVGLIGWYMDDFELFECRDCDQNNQADSRDLTFTQASDLILGIGLDPPPSYTLIHPPLAEGDVAITFSAIVDLAFVEESILVEINSTPVAVLFEIGAEDCPHVPDETTITLSQEVFNEFASTGAVTVTMFATEDVDPGLCRDSGFMKIFFQYNVKDADTNHNQVLDVCEPCAFMIPPLPERNAVPKNRYLSFIPEFTGFYNTVKVTLIEAPPGLEEHVGKTGWAGHPINKGSFYRDDFEGMITRSKCEPFQIMMRQSDLVHISSDLIVPGAKYSIETKPTDCSPPSVAGAESHFLTIQTSVWGDVVGQSQDAPPDGIVDENDVLAVLNVFESKAFAINATRADLHPAMPDQDVNILDLLQVIDASLGRGYPFPIPSSCN